MAGTKFKETEIGLIPEDWDIKTLPDVSQNMDRNRKPLSSRERAERQGDIPYYGAAGIIDYIAGYKYDGDFLLIAEDGTVTSNGDKPMLQLPSGRFWVSNHAHVLRVEPKSDLKFLYYALSNTPVSPFITGAVQPKLSQENMNKIKFPWPGITERERIAGILGTLDGKIELNRKMNKTLEEIGETMLQNVISKSEINLVQLKSLGQIVCGKTPSKANSDFFRGDTPFIKIPDMHGQVFIIKTEDSLSEEGKNSQINKIIPAGSICVSCIATVGLVSIASRDSQTNQQINSIVPNKKESTYFLYLTMKNMKEEFMNMGSGGSATLNINTSSFGNIEIRMLPDCELDKFNNVIGPLFENILINTNEIEVLSQLRDSLLPKLMSGKVRVV